MRPRTHPIELKNKEFESIMSIEYFRNASVF